MGACSFFPPPSGTSSRKKWPTAHFQSTQFAAFFLFGCFLHRSGQARPYPHPAVSAGIRRSDQRSHHFGGRPPGPKSGTVPGGKRITKNKQRKICSVPWNCWKSNRNQEVPRWKIWHSIISRFIPGNHRFFAYPARRCVHRRDGGGRWPQ